MRLKLPGKANPEVIAILIKICVLSDNAPEIKTNSSVAVVAFSSIRNPCLQVRLNGPELPFVPMYVGWSLDRSKGQARDADLNRAPFCSFRRPLARSLVAGRCADRPSSHT